MPKLEMITSPLPKIYPFQTSIETVRAHHWRNFVDLFQGCAFNCQYCLYKGPDDYGKHVAPIEEIQQTVHAPEVGILDIGAMTDPYQPLEESSLRTRRLLETLDANNVPTFVLTRGTLILRDVDILTRMASRGLVEVCISIISLRDTAAKALEPGAPTPDERIAAARALVKAGVPVSFHIAPLIPGLDKVSRRIELAEELAEAGARHIFLAMLGARHAYWSSFLKALGDDVLDEPEVFNAAYGDISFVQGAATTCGMATSHQIMEPFIDVATRYDIAAISENFPCYTTQRLEGGIYRWKLPTAYEMAEWIREQREPVSWQQFLAEYYQPFLPSEPLVKLVHQAWESGGLFEGSTVMETAGGTGLYAAASSIAPSSQRTLVARRSGGR